MSINRPLCLIIAGAAIATAGALAVPAWRHLHETPAPPPPALRLALMSGNDLSMGAGPDHPFGLTLSPDGRRIVFPAARAGAAQLWVRDLTTDDIAALPGSENGVLPFFARDRRQLAFFADGRLKLLSFETGQVADLAEAPAPRGGAWDGAGNIIFAPRNDGGLMRRKAEDGGIEPFTALDANAGETSHRFPVVDDEGRHVIFFVRAQEAQRSGIWIAPIDRPEARARLIGSPAHGLVSGEWLIYGRDEALLAQRLTTDDAGAMPALTGRPLLLGTPVGTSALNQLSASVAADAVVFGAPQPELRELRWIDRQDATASTLAAGVDAWDVRIAPRGGRVAVIERDPQLGTLDVQVYEGGRPLPRRISQAIGGDESPAWSRDGSRLAWVQAGRTITVRGALAELPEQNVRRFDVPLRLWDWAPDGQRFAIGFSRPATREDIFIVAANGTGEPAAYAQSAFNETHAAISPDGRWLAYASDESGQLEIYVDAFPEPGRRARVSVGGGAEPRWVASGHELLFRRGSEIHAVTISFGEAAPEATATTRLADAGGEIRSFDVSPDGQRIVANVPAPDSKADPATVVINWRSLLPPKPESH
jgi:hypothetical protein